MAPIKSNYSHHKEGGEFNNTEKLQIATQSNNSSTITATTTTKSLSSSSSSKSINSNDYSSTGSSNRDGVVKKHISSSSSSLPHPLSIEYLVGGDNDVEMTSQKQNRRNEETEETMTRTNGMLMMMNSENLLGHLHHMYNSSQQTNNVLTDSIESLKASILNMESEYQANMGT